MTVLLVGIGADTTNCTPTPPVYEDGRFEYVPIPERVGPAGTSEHRTYGNTRLRHETGPLQSAVDAVFPEGRGGPVVRGDAVGEWPLHYDPNFEALTYGETASRAAYIVRLRELEPGDVVAFYTGLQSTVGGARDRYLIGAFTVDTIVDFRRIPAEGGPVSFRELSAATRDELMAEHAANAHAKRYFARGEITPSDDGLIIVDGTIPGGRFERAMPISRDGGGPHYYLRERLEEQWSPAPNGQPNNTAYLGGVKPAHLLDVAPEEFWVDVAPYHEGH